MSIKANSSYTIVDVVDGLNWQGNKTSAPLNPKIGWAYYNTTDRKSYLYDGEKWCEFSRDGDAGLKGKSVKETKFYYSESSSNSTMSKGEYSKGSLKWFLEETFFKTIWPLNSSHINTYPYVWIAAVDIYDDAEGSEGTPRYQLLSDLEAATLSAKYLYGTDQDKYKSILGRWSKEFDRTFIDGGSMITGSIEADKMNVNELSAITGNMGTLRAGVIQSPNYENKEIIVNKNESEIESEEQNITDETTGLVFKLINNKEYSVVGYINTPTDIEIPNSFNNLPITSIGKYAFYGCTSLTSVVIGDSVTSIGDEAFYGCSSLTNINIGNNIINIGYEAFSECTRLKYNVKDGLNYLGNQDNDYLYLININSKDIVSININSGCRVIGSDAFYECISLKEINIPDSVISICDYAFCACSSLENITIPNNIINIGECIFSYCTSLTSIEIPNSVTRIGNEAFHACSSLTSIEIPNSVTRIGDYAFSSCKSLTSIEIPDSVKDIGDYAFLNCSIETVYYNKSIKDWLKIHFNDEFSNPLNNKAILYCEKEEIKKVSLSNINQYALCGCSSLEEVEIRYPLVVIPKNSFKNCENLKTLTFNRDYYDYSHNGFDDITIEIQEGALSGVSLKTATLPKKITSDSDSVLAFNTIENIFYQGQEDEKDTGIAFINSISENTTWYYYKVDWSYPEEGFRFSCDDAQIISSANFKVKKDGQVFMTNANVSGKIAATKGNIAGYIIDDTTLTSGGVGMNSASSEYDEEGNLTKEVYSFWAGNEETSSAPFRVRDNGALFASNASIEGKIIADEGKFGALNLKNNSLSTDDTNFLIDKDGIILNGGKRIAIGSTSLYSSQDTGDATFRTGTSFTIKTVDGAGITCSTSNSSHTRNFRVNIGIYGYESSGGRDGFLAFKTYLSDENGMRIMYPSEPLKLEIDYMVSIPKKFQQIDTINDKYIQSFTCDYEGQEFYYYKDIADGNQNDNDRHYQVYLLGIKIYKVNDPENYLTPTINYKISTVDDLNPYVISEFQTGTIAPSFDNLSERSFKSLISGNNLFTMSTTAGGIISTTCNIIPSSSGVYNLGSAEGGLRWKSIYCDNINGEAQTNSDKNLKNTINTLDNKYSILFDSLKPVSFKYNDGTSDRTHTGFIAQEVKDAIDKAGLTTQDVAAYCEEKLDDGEIIRSLRYSEFIALCVKEIQDLKARVKELENNSK